MRPAKGVRLRWWREGWDARRCRPKVQMFRSKSAALARAARIQAWAGSSPIEWITLEEREELVGRWREVSLVGKRGAK